MRFKGALVSSVVPFLLALPCFSQDVISAHSGLIHFSEGSVFLDDHSVDQKAANFPSINQGSTLRTEKGRAEVLLTPSVFLRLDENSAIRMVSNSLTDTRVEFLRGSAIIDSMEAKTAPPLTLIYAGCEIHFPKPGVYRLDSDTDVLQAYSGQAQIIPPDGKAIDLDSSHMYFFAPALETKKFADSIDDEFYDWARDRSDAIAAENQLNAQSAGDPADLTPDPNSPALPGANVPYYPNYPTYSVPGPDTTFSLGTPFYNPYFPFGPGVYTPSITYIFPVIVLGYPGTWPHSRWPHPTTTSGINSIYGSRAGTGLVSPYAPLRLPGLGSRPIIPARPIRSVPAYHPPSVGVSHPTLIAPHPVAPAAVHPMIHR